MLYRLCNSFIVVILLNQMPCVAAIIGQWDFETTTFQDSSGAGHHLSLATGSVGLTPGVVGNAALFNGTGFLYNSSPTLTTSQTQFSTGAWVRSNQTQGGDAIILGNLFPDFNAGITLHLTDLFGYVGDGGNNVNTQAVSGFTINNDEWHHVAQTFDGSTMRLYFDGAEIASNSSIFSSTGAASEFSVGGKSVLANTFVGAIDEAFYADHAMTPTEIQSLALVSAVPEPSSIVLVATGAGVFCFRRRRKVLADA